MEQRGLKQSSLRRCARYFGAMGEGINGAKGLKTKIAASLRRCARYIGAMEEGINGAKGGLKRMYPSPLVAEL